MSIRKIVITGGPCAGKSTALITLKKHYEELGMRVLVINETATELIMSGVAPWTCESNLEYQRCQLKLQLEKERVYEQAARGMKDEEILIATSMTAPSALIMMPATRSPRTLITAPANFS